MPHRFRIGAADNLDPLSPSFKPEVRGGQVVCASHQARDLNRTVFVCHSGEHSSGTFCLMDYLNADPSDRLA